MNHLREIKAAIKLMHYGKDGCITKKKKKDICFFIMIKWFTCCFESCGIESQSKKCSLLAVDSSNNQASMEKKQLTSMVII